MAFYGERFRRPDEEDIWEELRQMILNPPSEEEIALKKQQEQAQINAILDRVFPDIEKPAKEPYLTREELFGLDGQTTGMAAPLLEGKISYDLPRDPFKEIDENPNLSDEEKAQRKEQVVQSMKKYKDENNKINREHAWEQTKNYGGAALEIGSAFVPGYGGAKLAGTLAGKVAPKLGRKIAQEIATGTLKGASSGTVEGLGRGLLDDKNPLVTAAQDTLTGAALGSAGGAVGGNVEKSIRGNKLKQYGDIDLLDKNSRKQYSKDARAYYQDYNQGIVVNKDGPIEITNRGQREVLRWNPKLAKNFPELIHDIKKADRLPNISNMDNEKIYTDHFEVYRGKLGDHLVEVNKNGNRRYYTTKDISEGSLRAPSTGTFGNANNIITSPNTNLNPQASNQTLQPPKSHNQWLEDLKRKRKKRWF